MRTTVTIDDDVATTTKEMAVSVGEELGLVVSNVAREALSAPATGLAMVFDDILGIYILPRALRTRPLTLEMVNKLRDDDQ